MSKVILITGSTDGIGKLAAMKLAKDGHTVYVHGRNADKLKTVIEEIKTSAQNEKIIGLAADFSDLDAVATLSGVLTDQIDHLDVLVNNAGIFKSPTALAKNGLDIRIVVNYLAAYQLTRALLPLLKKSTEPRIINLSSAAQERVLNAVLSGQEQVTDYAAYAQSKLAVLIWSFYLAKQEPAVSTIALNPGSLLNTNMVREAFGRHWSSADKGANIIYDLSVTDKGSNASGLYFDNDQEAFAQAHPDAYDDTLIADLIAQTERLLG